MEAKGVAPDDRAFGSLITRTARARPRGRRGGARARARVRRAAGGPASRRPVKRVARARRRPGGGFHPANPTGAGAAAGEACGPKDEKKKMKPGVVLFHRGERVLRRGDMQSARRVVDEMRAAPKSRRATPNDRTFAHPPGATGRSGTSQASPRPPGSWPRRVPAPQLGGAERARARLPRVRPPGGARRPHGGEPARRARAPARGRAPGRARRRAAAAAGRSAAKDEATKGARPGADAKATRKPTRAAAPAAPLRGDAHRSDDGGGCLLRRQG